MIEIINGTNFQLTIDDKNQYIKRYCNTNFSLKIHLNDTKQNLINMDELSVKLNELGIREYKLKQYDGTLRNITSFSSFLNNIKGDTFLSEYEILNYAFDGYDTIPLIKIDQWDFNHQQYYYFENMVKVPSSYKFYAEHKYDNTVTNHHSRLIPQS